MSLKIVAVHFDCAGSRNLGGWCFSRLRSRCGAVRIFVHGLVRNARFGDFDEVSYEMLVLET